MIYYSIVYLNRDACVSQRQGQRREAVRLVAGHLEVHPAAALGVDDGLGSERGGQLHDGLERPSDARLAAVDHGLRIV